MKTFLFILFGYFLASVVYAGWGQNSWDTGNWSMNTWGVSIVEEIVEGTYWAEARTDYWTDTREALWETARNTEIPE